jgi:hypothetical protein
MWLPNLNGTQSDLLLQQLITSISRRISSLISGRSGGFIGVMVYNETRNGSGTGILPFARTPVLEVNSLAIDTVTIGQAANALSTGYIFDNENISLLGWLGAGAVSRVFIGPNAFYRHRGNIQLNYTAGWTLPNQGQADVSRSVPAFFGATVLPASNNAGNFVYVCTIPGNTSGASPAFNQTPGGTTQDGSVVWANTGLKSLPAPLADGTANLLPDDVVEACIEWVGLRFRERDRIGLTAETMGGQQTTGFLKDPMPASVKDALDPYRNVVPVMN